MSRRKPTPQMLADAERDLALGSAVRALIARNEVVLIERLDGAHLVSVGQRLGTEALADKVGFDRSHSELAGERSLDDVMQAARVGEGSES